MHAHLTAILDPAAKIHPSCKIGPYCTVGANVELGEACELISHVAIDGPTKIGAHNHFFPFSSIGLAPQDISYNSEPTRLEIGDHNIIREFVTINRDVLPFSKTAAERGTRAYGLNAVGLERRGFTKERIRKIHHAYKLLLTSKLNTSQALEKLKSEANRGEDVEMLIKFIETSERGVVK